MTHIKKNELAKMILIAQNYSEIDNKLSSDLPITASLRFVRIEFN